MDFLVQFLDQYDRLINILSSLLGIAGFIFGVWRYLRERQARDRVGDLERELQARLAGLRHLKGYADGVDQYTSGLR